MLYVLFIILVQYFTTKKTAYASHVSQNWKTSVQKPLCTVVVSKGPEGVVALTRYRGLQFSSSYSSQCESLPHVVGEGGERMWSGGPRTVSVIGISVQLSTEYTGVMGRFPDEIYPRFDHPSMHVWRPFYPRFPTCVLHNCSAPLFVRHKSIFAI